MCMGMWRRRSSRKEADRLTTVTVELPDSLADHILAYPAADRNGAALTFENALIGIGSTAAANILQEFVIRKLTPNPSNSRSTAKP